MIGAISMFASAMSGQPHRHRHATPAQLGGVVLQDRFTRFGLTVEAPLEDSSQSLWEGLMQRAEAAYNGYQFKEAQTLFQRAVDLADETGVKLWKAKGMQGVGRMHLNLDNYAQGAQQLQEALDLMAEASDVTATDMGTCYADIGELHRYWHIEYFNGNDKAVEAFEMSFDGDEEKLWSVGQENLMTALELLDQAEQEHDKNTWVASWIRDHVPHLGLQVSVSELSDDWKRGWIVANQGLGLINLDAEQYGFAIEQLTPALVTSREYKPHERLEVAAITVRLLEAYTNKVIEDLGEFDTDHPSAQKALSMFDDANADLLAVFGADYHVHPSEREGLMFLIGNMVHVAYQQHRPLDDMQEVLDFAKHARAPKQPLWSTFTHIAESILNNTEEPHVFEQARGYFEHALDYVDPDDVEARFQTLNIIADAANEAEEFALAVRYYRQATRVYEDLGEAGFQGLNNIEHDKSYHTILADQYRNIGLVYKTWHDESHAGGGEYQLFEPDGDKLDQSEQAYRQALHYMDQASDDERDGEWHENAAECYENLGSVFMDREDFAVAASHYQAAVTHHQQFNRGQQFRLAALNYALSYALTKQVIHDGGGIGFNRLHGQASSAQTALDDSVDAMNSLMTLLKQKKQQTNPYQRGLFKNLIELADMQRRPVRARELQEHVERVFGPEGDDDRDNWGKQWTPDSGGPNHGEGGLGV